MSRSLGVLTLDLATRIGGFERGLDKAARHTDKRMRDIEKRAKMAGKVIGVALVAAASAAVMAVGRTINAFDQLGKSASRMGVSVEALSRLEYAARLSDVSMETLSTSMRRLGQVQADVAKGAKEQTSLFRQLKVEALSSAGGLRDADLVLRDLADVFARMPDSQNKTTLATKLFGKAGAELIPLLNLGSEGLDEFARRSDQVGFTLDRKTTDAAQRFNDKLSEVRMAVEGMWRQAMPPLIEKLDDMADTLNSEATRQGLATVAQGLASIAVAAVNATAAIGNFAGKYTSWLADKGFMQASGGRNMQQLKARRDALQKMLGPVDESKWLDLTGPTPARKLFMEVTGAREGIEEELAEIEKLIANFPVRMVTGKATGSQDAPTIDFSLPGTGGGKSGKSGKAPDFAKDAADELRKLLEVEEQAREAFASMEAQLAGPLAAAFYQFSVDQERLNEQARIGAIDTDRLTQAQANLRKAYEADVEAIEARLNPGRQLIEDLEFELSLIGLSNDARETAIALRYAEVDAMSAQGKEIEGLIAKKNRELAIERDQIETMDALRDSTRGFLDDLSEGVGIWESLKNAADSFADVLFDIASRKLIEQLFGKQGDSGGGGWGDAIGALFSRLWGGGKASGGTVMPGKLYEVGEHDRPEMLMAGGRQYLIPGNAGNVVPMHGGGSGVTQNIAFHLGAPTDPRTQAQIATRAGFEAQRALARNAG